MRFVHPRSAGGPYFDPTSHTILDFHKQLDLRQGLLLRQLRCQDVDGRITSITSLRLASMQDPHLATLSYRVTPENWSGHLTVRSAIDGAVENKGVARYRQLSSRQSSRLSSQ